MTTPTEPGQPTLEDLGLTRLQLRRWNILANLRGDALQDLADRERELKPLLDEGRFDDYVRQLDDAYGLPIANDDEYAEDAVDLALKVGRERTLLKLDPLAQVIARGCDHATPSVYAWQDGSYRCRCMVCARCGHHTGNTSQGHWWALCKVTGTKREHHFCCGEPDGCELETSAKETTHA